jgi:Gas vesicle protein G
MLLKLLGLPLSLPAAGLRFCFNQIIQAVDAELLDDAPVKEALLLLQLQLEEGEIEEDEFQEREAELFQRLREIRAYRDERLREQVAEQGEDRGGVVIQVDLGEDDFG